MSFAAIILFALAIGVALMLPVAGVWLAIHLVRAVTWVLAGLGTLIGAAAGGLARFVGGVITDTGRCVGHVVTALCALPLALASLSMLRFKAGGHYGRALEDALYGCVISIYRVVLGHPLRLIGFGALSDSIEVGAPSLFAAEPRTAPAGLIPRRQASSGRAPQFEGYKVKDELRAGGSGARLFLAQPAHSKREALAKRGLEAQGDVVIKAFDRRFGSTVPQIVRESRALEAARGLGLVLEHVTHDDSFYYVMPFVPGRDLDLETKDLHERSGGAGLGKAELTLALGYARDLCQQLTRFHEGGLWHKDIKPSNLLVSEGRLRVVDFGLVTPLESALTLTTHGTEFFRDPELVRLALAGKRVQDVDGVKFDLYSAGAVLYSMMENSFPAHGSLSSISKEVPEGLRWIVRRSMADVEKRYGSAREMLSDVLALLDAPDPYAVPLAALPSVSGATAPPVEPHAPPSPDSPVDDVKRFSAFGFTAEIGGLGRATRSLQGARTRLAGKRAQLAAKRDAAREEREREAEARSRAKEEERNKRRSRRRSALRGFMTVAVCAVLLVVLEGAINPSKHGGERTMGVPELPPITPEVMTMGLNAPRVLVLSSPDDPDLAELSIQHADRLATYDITPLGVRMDDPEALDLLSLARYRLDSSGPSVHVQRRALQNMIREVETLDGVHWIKKSEHGELVLCLLNGKHYGEWPLSLVAAGDGATPEKLPAR